jgi:hypothetical protein
MKLTHHMSNFIVTFDDGTVRRPRIEVRKHTVQIGCLSVSRHTLTRLLAQLNQVGIVQAEGGIDWARGGPDRASGNSKVLPEVAQSG